ncbi:MAG: GH25 family lysozyme [Rothia sp. (in: high G+C Gram-positive bacteria)]|nr:GH25 family lysozyme [Rothia sp. (in: high G+C Gram-positive bacteria)]
MKRSAVSLSLITALMLPVAPAFAASSSTSELSQSTNGKETKQVQELLPETDALAPAQLSSAPPKTGEGNPGATMGQGLKKLSETSNLSAESLKKAEQQVSAAKSGKDVSVNSREFSSALEQATEEANSKVQSAAAAVSPTGSGTLGMDVSAWQPVVDWDTEYANGARFVYIKATEGDSYASSAFSNQYVGATSSGLTRGAYHFALPTEYSSGAEQARYFVAHGGGWSADGRTLPGLLDIEYNPYSELGDMCYGFSQPEMRGWIESFVSEYKSLTGRVPAVYTTTDWWQTCTGNTSLFNYLPLHLANYSSTPGYMPNGWSTYDIWQYSPEGPFSGDSNVFNGTLSDLRSFATVASYQPKGARNIPTITFKDVPTSHPFYTEISWLASTGITTGWSDNTFRPSNNVTRDAMAAFMYRLAGEPAYTPPARSRFTDVPTSHPFYKEISWLAEQGISTGWDDGTYRPDNKITRDAMAAFMYRLAGQPTYQPPAVSYFKDVPTNSMFYKEISWMRANRVSTGWDDGTYRPNNEITREAMAAFIYRYARIA